MNSLDDAQENTEDVIGYFNELLRSYGESGDIGFAKFSDVYDSLIPVQQEKLRSIADNKFEVFYEKGSIACVGIAYTDPIIDNINTKTNGQVDYNLWNNYASEYNRINQVLDRMSRDIASRYGGIALTATIDGVIGEVNTVQDYFSMVVSHRAIAELAGLGWRGKNQLIIHEKFSCAIRFASILFTIPLVHNHQIESKCGNCNACEVACSFIKHRDTLPEYRENCRLYILSLMKKGIKYDICGKCIKACYRRSLLKDEFDLS